MTALPIRIRTGNRKAAGVSTGRWCGLWCGKNLVLMPKRRAAQGQKGLMQLMSSTAIYVTKDRRLRRDTSPLFETEYNLETGQRYVSYLMEKRFYRQ